MNKQSLFTYALMLLCLCCSETISIPEDDSQEVNKINVFTWGNALITYSSNTDTSFHAILGFNYKGSFSEDSLSYKVQLKLDNQILNQEEYQVDSVQISTFESSSSINIHFFLSGLIENRNYTFTSELDYNGKKKNVEEKGFKTEESSVDKPALIEFVSEEVNPGVRNSDLTINVKILDEIPNSVFDFTYYSELFISTESVPTYENRVGFDQIEEIGVVNLDLETKEGISWRSIVALEPNTTYYYEHIFYYDNLLDDIESQSVSTGIKSFTTKEEILEYGGIVFYDKGEITNGWRYLVSAEKNWFKKTNLVEPFLPWGCDSTYVENLEDGLGDGLKNTQTIVEQNCTSKGVADFLVDLELNGYSDWYLGSPAEVKLLFKKGL